MSRYKTTLKNGFRINLLRKQHLYIITVIQLLQTADPPKSLTCVHSSQVKRIIKSISQIAPCWRSLKLNLTHLQFKWNNLSSFASTKKHGLFVNIMYQVLTGKFSKNKINHLRSPSKQTPTTQLKRIHGNIKFFDLSVEDLNSCLFNNTLWIQNRCFRLF